MEESAEPGPRSPHEREIEFQGLFTPAYLPLLDSTDRNERRANSLTRIPIITTTEPKPVPTARSQSDDTALPTVSTASSFDSSSSRSPKRPSPRRRNTDEASIHSDTSEGQAIRRSALRRSSSGSKPGTASPRRVRFEFEGREFPTTSSPMGPASPLKELPSIPITSEDEDGGTVQQVEYMEEAEREESPPPPKRISSSQALRALSKAPIEDDGTQWTEVRAPPDGSASIERTGNSDEDSDEEFLGIGSRRKKSKGKEAVKSNGTTASDSAVRKSKAQLKSPPPEPASAGTIDDVDEHEHEDTLSELAPAISAKTALGKEYGTPLSPKTLSEKLSDKAQTTSTTHVQSPTQSWFAGAKENDPSIGKLELSNGDGADEDEDELFDFDESPAKPTTKHGGDVSESDEEESDEDDLEEDDALPEMSGYATSPARAIIKPKNHPAASSSPNFQNDTGSHTGAEKTEITSTKSSNGNNTSSSIRAQRIHPFNTPIVSADIHAQAASLGQVSSFVGSVKDMDFSGSYGNGTGAGSLRNGSVNIGSVMGSGDVGVENLLRSGGQPRSFSERMALEDYMEMQQRGRGGATEEG